jgi:enamine deaminase RidA (YjgF/YER057c/UK114 family)
LKEAINPPSLPAPPGYSQLIRTAGGTTVYIAGQVAWDSDNELVGAGDFEAQTRQVLVNLIGALEAVGAVPEDLVKICIYIVDLDRDKLDTLRRVRDELLGDITPPVSTLLGVARLALPELMVEIDAIAVV